MEKLKCSTCGGKIQLNKGDVAEFKNDGRVEYVCRKHFKKYGRPKREFSFGRATSVPESYTNYGNSNVHNFGHTHFNNHDLIELTERINENA